MPDLAAYDRFVVFFSGGKDSVAAVLHLLDQGVERERIELHHHLVDGNDGDALMDWECTDSYCRKFAEAFGLKLLMSWKVGGFRREMLRDHARTAPVAFESELGGVVMIGGTGGKFGTRRKFPQTVASLQTRWCSAYLKVDVGARLLCNEPRFRHGKTLVITGERAQESASRACYKAFEPNRSDLRHSRAARRHIDHWRPIHKWLEEDVWRIIEKYRVNAHPAYWVGFGRCSCRTCIFGSRNQWATIRLHWPRHFKAIADYEREFKVTIHRSLSVDQQADLGTPYQPDPQMVRLAESPTFDAPIIMDVWKRPPGAFGESDGPT
ncbi:MAG: phosphoadenosine phosphosulfate reductase [Cupriavidus sp.]|nr:MAG: phosphoadenosine phosphosulfate reductase [Cupriavidus sp.]